MARNMNGHFEGSHRPPIIQQELVSRQQSHINRLSLAAGCDLLHRRLLRS